MNINYQSEERELTIIFHGEIDHHSCLEVSQMADDAIRKYLPNKVIFDFREVSFMDSSGIGMLLRKI